MSSTFTRMLVEHLFWQVGVLRRDAVAVVNLAVLVHPLVDTFGLTGEYRYGYQGKEYAIADIDFLCIGKICHVQASRISDEFAICEFAISELSVRGGFCKQERRVVSQWPSP